MKNKTESQKTSPPRLISSLVAGFNAIANNIYVIIFPLGLDLLLWFGPRLRLKSLLEPFINSMFTPLDTFPPEISNSAEITIIIKAAKDLWQFTLEHFNMLGILRSYPIGVPSLLSVLGPLNNPLNSSHIFEVPTIYIAIFLWIVIYLSGLLIGCIFFNELSRHTSQQNSNISIKIIVYQFAQILGLTISFIFIITLLSVPSIVLLTILSFINPIITQIGLLFISFIILWLLIPLIFSAHGIFTNQQNFIFSIITSIRLVRYTFATTSMFILVTFLISQGLDVLWRSPSDSSWMSLVGIFGHAFVSTSLIAASFFYYRIGISWINELLLVRS